MLSVSGSGEMFPIKNTFIHFSDVAAGARRRCLSSPAEVFAELVWQANAKLEQVRAKKRAARKVRRWAQLVRGAWQALGQKHLDDARNLQRFWRGRVFVEGDSGGVPVYSAPRAIWRDSRGDVSL